MNVGQDVKAAELQQAYNAVVFVSSSLFFEPRNAKVHCKIIMMVETGEISFYQNLLKA